MHAYDDLVVRLITDAEVKLFDIGLMCGVKIKTSEFFEQEQYINLLIGTDLNLELMYGKFFNENEKMEIGKYFCIFLDPEIKIDIVSTLSSFWFLNKLILKIGYGIKLIDITGNINENGVEIINYISIGIGNI